MSGLVRVVLVVLGIIAVVVGVIYLIEPVHSLPSFFPGHAAGQTHHHIRGYIAIAVGVILLIIAAVAGRSRRRAY
jgi:NADH:ubiquinone oxidoreductase subunit 5 (subunit L)/multisubunit Na+/H+ antiporter MnhA subunit